MRQHQNILLSLILLLSFSVNALAESSSASEPSISDQQFILFLQLDNQFEIDLTLQNINETWNDGYIPILLELLTFARVDYAAEGIVKILNNKTGQNFGLDIPAWYKWLWNQPDATAPRYANFKSELYNNIDTRFAAYFHDRYDKSNIRLDEVRWGGVLQDGIPPLRNPEMISAENADFLDDSNIVFGIEINGDARAYPKRILAWHEMFTDTVGGTEIAGVYCTLCGTVIPYKTRHNDVSYQLGTSGFLYRSNKLMYDKKTQTLWNTLHGEPVIGPLVGKGIRLEFFSVVTTTWGEWKKRHPNTSVLSPNTGHQRDYGEGVAYKNYFATDRVMFNTPFDDTRLKNKQEVVGLRFPASPKDQLAIDTEFLNKNTLYTDIIGQQKLLVLTDKSGANRVYDPAQITFEKYDGDLTAVDSSGQQWTMHEQHLLASDGRKLSRIPSHRAFWFGWHAAFPETRLVK